MTVYKQETARLENFFRHLFQKNFIVVIPGLYFVSVKPWIQYQRVKNCLVLSKAINDYYFLRLHNVSKTRQQTNTNFRVFLTYKATRKEIIQNQIMCDRSSLRCSMFIKKSTYKNEFYLKTFSRMI